MVRVKAMVYKSREAWMSSSRTGQRKLRSTPEEDNSLTGNTCKDDRGGDSNIKTNYIVEKNSALQTWTYFSLHESEEKDASRSIPEEEFNFSIINMSFIQFWQLFFGLGIMLGYYYRLTWLLHIFGVWGVGMCHCSLLLGCLIGCNFHSLDLLYFSREAVFSRSSQSLLLELDWGRQCL